MCVLPRHAAARQAAAVPPGDILAPDDLSKGVWRRVLGPGPYRLNPEGYDIAVLSAVTDEIRKNDKGK